MKGKYLLPLLAVVGFVIAVVAVVIDNRPPPSPVRPALQSPKAPFASYVGGTGIIEASSGNIAVGTPVPGIVTAIYVKWGDHVRAGDMLFKVDDRDLQAQLVTADAAVEEGKARLAQAQGRLEIAERVADKRAISVEELRNRRSAVAVEAAGVGAAEAKVEEIRLRIKQRTVRAPVTGEILRLEVHPGEYADNAATATPLLVLGSDKSLYLRVDVDEYDAWRVRRDARAVAYLPGNPDLHTDLRFTRIDPYVVPKRSLSGGGTERTDTRVLQVIYSFDPAALPNTYVGQQLDVYIEARPAGALPGTQHPAGAQ